MSYESDYRRQPVSSRSHDYPMDYPNTGGSSKGLLIFALIIGAFIAFVVVVSLSGSPDTGAPVAGDAAVQTLPEAGSAGQVAPTASQ